MMTCLKLHLFSVAVLIVGTTCPLPAAAQQYREPERSRDRSTESHGQQTNSAQRQPTPEQYIDRFDSDGNGALDREEASRWLRRRFDRLDRNGDNWVTANELERGRRLGSVRAPDQRQTSQRQSSPVEVVYIWVADLDRGTLSLNDLQSAYQTLQEIDGDGNGEITRSELQERRGEMLDRWAQRVLDRHDNNGDDRISRGEASGSQLEQMFGRLDGNGDDFVSNRELRRSLSSQFRPSTRQGDDGTSTRTQAFRSQDVDR
jgi:Ca2+-binding EF-hand superfamily protein